MDELGHMVSSNSNQLTSLLFVGGDLKQMRVFPCSIKYFLREECNLKRLGCIVYNHPSMVQSPIA